MGVSGVQACVLQFGPVDLASGISFHVHITSPTTAATCGTVNNSASATTTNDGNPSAGPIPIMVNCAIVTITKTPNSTPLNSSHPNGSYATVTIKRAGTARNVTVA